MSKIKHVSLTNLEKYTEQLKAKYAQKSEIPKQVSDLTNDAKYQTEEQVASAISAKIASTYKAGGSLAAESLTEALLIEANEGLVYNMTDEFTTNDKFKDPTGKTHPAGTNVAVVKDGDSYKFDVLSGFVDLSSYAQTDQVASDIESAKTAAVQQAASAVDEKLAGYVKTADVEEVTEEEITALFED